MIQDATDRSLLERFVARREEAAFAALVQRHGPRVLGVCRRILHNDHDAEDVVQATFLVLARKAVVIPWEESVCSWLAAVAARLAWKARSAGCRQRGRERPVGSGTEFGLATLELPERPDANADPLQAVARRELRRLLDDELYRLPEKYRVPVVLCYLEGKTNEEAARELGWPAGSMSRRLARARALLRERLTGRGLALSGGLVVIVLTALLALQGTRQPGPAPIGQLMSQFAPAPQGGNGFAQTLASLADGDSAQLDASPEALARSADAAAAVAEQLQQHDPGRERLEWAAFAERMRGAAVELAAAARAHDRNSAVAAARRLHASCNQCHAAFR